MAKIILTTHQKGGVGKSTITYNLAENLKSSAEVCIVDMDSQGSLLHLSELAKVPIFSGSELKKIINSDYDFIFIDTPPYLNDSISDLCKMADVIIIPTKAGILDLLAIKSTIDIVKEAKSEKKAVIVFNMVKPNTTLTSEMHEAMEQHKIPIAENYISDLVAFTRSAITNELTDQKAKLQIENLTREVLEKIV